MRRPPSSLAIWGWVTAGVAVAALVPGVLWLALEGQCAMGSAEDEASGLCIDVYYTWPQGLALTSLALALGATSVALFVVDGRRRARERATVALSLLPAPSGGLVGVVGRF